MSQFPRVTVITPSYNQAAFLEETIRSVLSQEYPNLEYMIFDGGSKDGSVEIIQRYADHLACWVSEKDRGQADAINKGLARATGDIVAWLNSDDYYLPGAIHQAVAELQAHPEAGMVFGDVVSIDAAGTPFNVMTFGDWGLEELLQFNIIGQPSVFVRRDVLEKAGTLDLSLDLLLDVELWMRVARVAPIRYVPKRWSAARYHAGAKNVSQAPKYGQDAYRVVERMAKDPALADLYQKLRRRIWAGAFRFDAHYLLDGGKPAAALRSYLRSLWYYPPTALPEANRILYAFASLFVDVSWLKQRYLKQRKEKLNLS